MPIEALAKRGKDTLRFGPLKPVGIKLPDSEIQPYAVVQLRKDNKEGTLYNMVGFQTRLKWPEQKRIFRLIPGLESAQFVRLESCTGIFYKLSSLLQPTLQMKEQPGVFWAGQITGVEGYVESAAMGLVAGINAFSFIKGELPLVFPRNSPGALVNYITTTDFRNFQPMNINFGLFPAFPTISKKVEKNYYQKEV